MYFKAVKELQNIRKLYKLVLKGKGSAGRLKNGGRVGWQVLKSYTQLKVSLVIS